MNKEEMKNYLIIFFVVFELLSMIFNFYFIKVTLGTIECNLNFSIIFFCLGFFVVDIVADQFSAREANKFIFYKLVSQVLFLVLGNISIQVYGLQETQIANILNKSPWMILSGLASTCVGFYAMSTIMSYMKVGVYQGTSVFNRYLCSTIPGELLFSLVFTTLCFYKYNSFHEIIHIFLTSALAKIILSILFALFMSIISRFTFLSKYLQEQEVLNAGVN